MRDVNDTEIADSQVNNNLHISRFQQYAPIPDSSFESHASEHLPAFLTRIV